MKNFQIQRLNAQVDDDYFQRHEIKKLRNKSTVRDLHSFVTHNTGTPFYTLQVRIVIKYVHLSGHCCCVCYYGLLFENSTKSSKYGTFNIRVVIQVYISEAHMRVQFLTRHRPQEV